MLGIVGHGQEAAGDIYLFRGTDSAPSIPATMATYTTEHVTEVARWSEKLFSFTTTRSASLRFESGQFLMVGLELGARRLVRAYSIASPPWDERLEFYSIIAPRGPLTSRLKDVQRGTPVLVSSKPTGTLVLRDLRPGRRLFLLATGTGVAPFAALIRDPEVYERFERVILVRGGRTRRDLAYGDAVIAKLRTNPWLGELAQAHFIDYPSVTRDSFVRVGRITSFLTGDQVCHELGLPPLDPCSDRVMVCGNLRMLADVRGYLDERGFELSPGIGIPGDYVIERAFVEAVSAGDAAARTAVRHGACG
jgi:ferredoxin--NADP+ reductase